ALVVHSTDRNGIGGRVLLAQRAIPVRFGEQFLLEFPQTFLVRAVLILSRLVFFVPRLPIISPGGRRSGREGAPDCAGWQLLCGECCRGSVLLHLHFHVWHGGCLG